jgi:nitrogen regulatory protein P-II 1
MVPHFSRGRSGAFFVGPTEGGEDGGTDWDEGEADRRVDRGAPQRAPLPAGRPGLGRAQDARLHGHGTANEEGGIVVIKVEAVVVRDRVETVMEAVEAETGHVGVTVVEAVGHGREKGITHEYRGRVFESRFLPKALMTFIVRDEVAEHVIHAITDAAKTGHVNGDGICWMSPVANVTHNRTGQKLEEVEVV